MKVRMNKKEGRVVAWLMAVVMLLGMTGYIPGYGTNAEAAAKRDYWNGLVATRFAGGEGTARHPYLIKWGSQLAYLADLVNRGVKDSDGEEYSKKSYKLIRDIKLNDLDSVAHYKTEEVSADDKELQEWTAIGVSDEMQFAGTFDGDGHTISGLFTHTQKTNGLFGCVSDRGIVKNVIIKDSFVEGSGYGVGAVVGMNSGTIEDCQVISSRVVVVKSEAEETEEGNEETESNKAGPGGGVAGANLGYINGCSNEAAGMITAGVYGVNMIGGITGLNRGELWNCYNTSVLNSFTILDNNVIVRGQYGTGGIVGYNDNGGQIKNCYNRGAVMARGNVGGIVGINLDLVANCYNHGAITARDDGYGGEIAGTLQRTDDLSIEYKGKIRYCYWTIRMNDNDHSANFPSAGFIGMGASAENCYACDTENDCALKNTEGADVDISFPHVPDPGNNVNKLKDALISWQKESNDYCGLSGQCKNTNNPNIKYLNWKMDGATPSLPIFGEGEDIVEWNGTEDMSDFEGDGTENSPYRITSEGQLKHLAELVNGGTNKTFEGEYFIVTRDLKLNNDNYQFSYDSDKGLVKVKYTGGAQVKTAYVGTGIKGEAGGNDIFDENASVPGQWYANDAGFPALAENALEDCFKEDALHRWTPIGVRDDRVFKGNFNANGHTISGLFVNGLANAGLFGHVVAGEDEENGERFKLECEIKDIKINNSCVIGSGNTGTAVAYIEGDVTNCSVDNAIVTANDGYLGGVVGFVDHSSQTGEVKDDSHRIFGSGFGGYIYGGDESYEGGVIGYCGYGNTIEECYTTPGTFNVNITKAVEGRAKYVGGLCGWNYGSTIINSCNHLNVNDKSTAQVYAGGITGCNESKGRSLYPDEYDHIYAAVENSYNRGNVTCENSANAYVGGIAGLNKGGNIVNVYTDLNSDTGIIGQKETNCGHIAGANINGDGRYDFVKGKTQRVDIYESVSGTVSYAYSLGTKLIAGMLRDSANNVTGVHDVEVINADYSLTVAKFSKTALHEVLKGWIDSSSGGNKNEKYLGWKMDGFPQFEGSNYIQSTETEPWPIYTLTYDPNVGGQAVEERMRELGELSGEIKTKEYQRLTEDEKANSVDYDADRKMYYSTDDGREVPAISRCKFERDGFRFIGWCTEINDEQLPAKKSATNPGSKIYLAKGRDSITGLIRDFNPSDYAYVEYNTIPENPEEVSNPLALEGDTTLYAIWESTRVNVTNIYVEKEGDVDVYKLKKTDINVNAPVVKWDRVSDAKSYWIYRYKLEEGQDNPDFYNAFTFDEYYDKCQRFEETGLYFPGSDNEDDATLEAGVYYYGVRSISEVEKSGKNGSSTLKAGPMSYTVRVEIKSKDIVYHGNGGKTPDNKEEYSDDKIIVGNSAEIKDNTFERTGYRFMKWNTESNGTGDSYEPGDVLPIVDNEEDAERTIDMYALWQLEPVTLDVSNDDDSLVLVWHKHEADISKYVIYSSKNNEIYTYKDTVEVNGSDEYRYPIEKQETVTYYHVVAHKDIPSGNINYYEESEPSNAVTDAMLDLDKTKGIDNTGIDGNQIYLKWDKEDGVTGYEVFRSDRSNDLGEDTKLPGTVLIDPEFTNKENVTFEDSVPEVGTYYYHVRPFTEHRENGRLTSVEYGGFSVMCKVELKTVTIKYNSNVSNSGEGNREYSQETGLNFRTELDKVENMPGFTNEGFEFGTWSTRSDRITTPSYEDGATIDKASEDMQLYAMWNLKAPELTVVTENGEQVLRWDVNRAVDSYDVYQKENTGDYVRIAENLAPSGNQVESYALGTLDESNTYEFYVKAYHNDNSVVGTSLTKFSESNRVSVLPPADQVRNVVCTVNPDKKHGSYVQVEWDSVTGLQGFKGYHVFRQDPGSEEKILLDSVIPSGGNNRKVTYTDESIDKTKPGEYKYYVRAYAADADGEYYKNLSLPAVAELEAVKITYKSNGGKGNDVEQTVIKESSDITVKECVEDCKFSRDGYTFIEWYTTAYDDVKKEFKEVTYTEKDNDGNSTVLPTEELKTDVVLYARWKLSPVVLDEPVKVSTPNEDGTMATNVVLKWTENKNKKPSGYDVWEQKGENGVPHRISTDEIITGNTYTVKDIDTTTLYRYYVVPYENIETATGLLKATGLESNTVTVAADEEVVIDGQVTGLDGVVNNGAVDLTWNKLNGVTGYYIYRRTDDSKPTKEDRIAVDTTIDADQTSFTDDTVTDVIPYYYTVRGYVETEDSIRYLTFSNTIEVRFEKYTITYCKDSTKRETVVKDYIKGSKFSPIENSFSNGNKVFVSWNTDPTGKGYEYEPGKEYPNEINQESIENYTELYAIWRLQKPENVKAEVQADNKTVNISWDKVEGADGYVVYRQNKNDNDDVEKLTVIDNNCTDDLGDRELGENDGYFYYVRAYEIVSNDMRRLSEPSDVTPDSIIGNVKVDSDDIGVVENLKILAYEKDNSAKIGWSGLPEADGYFVYRSVGIDGPKTYTGLNVKGSNVNTGELDIDTPYYYYVAAYILDKNNDPIAIGDYSEGILVQITPSPVPSPSPTPEPSPTPNPYGKVINLTAVSTESGKADLTWDQLEGVSGYKVYYADNEEMNDKQQVGDLPETSLTVDNLPVGKTAYFIVRGYEPKVGVGYLYSDYSDVARVVIFGATPEPTASPEPSYEPEPSNEPEATASPEPSGEPEATASPEPGSEATASPEPSGEPEATASPEPGGEATPEPTTVPTEVPATEAPASNAPSASPEATKDPRLVDRFFVKDAYSQYINLIWDKADAAIGYEISYSTSLDGIRTVIAMPGKDSTSLDALPVTGAAFTVNENINASEIQAYNQRDNATYYYYIRAVLEEGYGNYSPAIIIALHSNNYVTPAPYQYVTPSPTQTTPTPAPIIQAPDDIVIHDVGDKVTKSKLIYQITKNTETSHTVRVVKPVKKTYKKITIPKTVKIDGVKFKVTAIKAKAFASNKKLTGIVIGANVTKIGAKAFYNCKKLKNITFKGKKVKKMGKNAFKGINSKCQIVIPKTVLKKYRNLIQNTTK